MNCTYRYLYGKVRTRNGSETVRPVITICYLKDDGGNLSRGIAICSPLDQFTKIKGRHIAHGRAIQAFKMGTGNPVCGEKGIDAFLTTGLKMGIDPIWKSSFCVQPNEALGEDDQHTIEYMLRAEPTVGSPACQEECAL